MTQASLLKINSDNIILSAFYKEKDYFHLHLYELGGKDTMTEFEFLRASLNLLKRLTRRCSTGMVVQRLYRIPFPPQLNKIADDLIKWDLTHGYPLNRGIEATHAVFQETSAFQIIRNYPHRASWEAISFPAP